MMKAKGLIASRVNGRNKVKIEDDGYDTYLCISTNGFQFSGTSINKIVAVQIIEALTAALANGEVPDAKRFEYTEDL